jgi:hypothetical protein
VFMYHTLVISAIFAMLGIILSFKKNKNHEPSKSRAK